MSPKKSARCVVFNDTRVDGHHGCSSVILALSQHLSNAGIRITSMAPAHFDWRENPEFVACLENADILVVNGEGTLHHSRPKGIPLLEVASFGHQLGIPTALINTTWQDNDDNFYEKLKQFDLVAVRDTLCAAEIQSRGITCRVVPDLSLSDDFYPTNKVRGGLGCVDSVLPETTRHIDTIRRSSGGKVVSIVERANSPWEFVKMMKASAEFRQPRNIVDLGNSLWSAWTSVTSQVATRNEFLELLAGLQLLVSGRYHACTLALLTETPFVAFSSNTRKIDALIQDVDLDERRLNPGGLRLGNDDLRRFAWSSRELQSIREYRETAHEKIDELFRDLALLA